MKRICFLVLGLFCSAVSAVSLNNIIMFGDSLSDNGNFYKYTNQQVPMSPPYYEGRFSNGPVWVEQLLASYYPNNSSDHLQDYAFGGAGVSEDPDDDALITLKSEIDTYLIAHQDKFHDNSLVTVWIGANNYLAMPDDNEATLKVVSEGIRHSLEKLAQKGAKHIFVLNLPDLGITPAAVELDGVDQLTELTQRHNERLAKVVEEVSHQYPEVQWIYFNVDTKMQDMIEHPDSYGLTNTTDTCYEASLSRPSSQMLLKMVSTVTPASKKDACDGYLFFDLVHPAVRAHEIMAQKAREILDEAGVEFTE